MIQKISLTLGIVAIIIAVLSLSGTVVLTSLNPNTSPEYTLSIEPGNSAAVTDIMRICNAYFNDFLILETKNIQNETAVSADFENLIIVYIYNADKTTVRKAAEKMFKDLPLQSIVIEEGKSIAEYHR